MPESKSHRMTSYRIARKYRAKYNSGAGVDVRTRRVAVEVETPKTVADAGRQLRGHRGPVYVAGTNNQAVNIALRKYRNTTIGVMDNRGNIIKNSTRKK